ncbi:putative IGP family C-type lectin domain containing protein [Leishmania naiffi]|uniref:IGP family C-type lectin domain containing protein n=1 Tax=Leishmania naiffi TaxID=5678 RepID=A0AAW3C3U8_9TRYP
MKLPASLPLAVLPVLLTLCGLAEVAQAQGLLGILALQMKGYTSYSSTSLSSSGIAVTYASTERTCFDAGGVPASDANTRLSNTIAYWMSINGGGSRSTIYTGSSAAPSLPNTPCAERVEVSKVPNSANCYYRWRYGFYDMYSYEGEPGTAYWSNLYLQTAGTSQILNQFEQFIWQPKLDIASKRYPRGYFGGIATMDTVMNGLFRMDAPLVPKNNDPNPLNSFMIVCEHQLYPERPPFTTRMPQPVFVNGFKTLMWSQSHWWVIFLIVAIIILAFLIFIVIYCCLTSIKPKEEPPLFVMVIRERVGKGYIVTDTASKATNQQYAVPGGMPQPPQMLSPAQEEQSRQMRYGRGFNPLQPQGAEDMSMGAAGIYQNGGRTQYAHGNVPTNPDGNLIGCNAMNISEDALSCQGLSLDGAGNASQAPSLVTSKRRSMRRSRNRNISQAFDDVEVPQAGEIDEVNVNL